MNRAGTLVAATAARGILFMAVLLAALMLATPALADGWVGADPAQNFPIPAVPHACTVQPDGAVCQNAGVYYLDQARASLGQPPYALPADFTSLSPIDRDLILTDLDRVLYGLPPVPGLTAALNADASAGVTIDDDPQPSDPDIIGWTANWAGAFPNIEFAYEAWMYDDGPGAHNLACQPTNMTGCWGHRHDILWSFPRGAVLAMGAASGLDPSGAQGYAMLLAVGGPQYAPTYTDTWASAQADGAGTNTYTVDVPTIDLPVYVWGAGSVSDGRGQTCTSSCTFEEPVNQAITLMATPAPGMVFTGWDSPPCGGTGTCIATPGSIYYAYAVFNLAPGASAGPGPPGPVPIGSGSVGPGTTSTGAPGRGGSVKTITSRPVLSVKIGRLTTSPGTIRAALRGSKLTCRLAQWRGHRWAKARVARCGTSVTYRKLPAGRYRLTVTAGRTSVTRIVTLRHGSQAPRGRDRRPAGRVMSPNRRPPRAHRTHPGRAGQLARRPALRRPGRGTGAQHAH